MMGGDSGPRSISGDKEEEEAMYFTFLPPHGRSGSPGQNFDLRPQTRRRSNGLDFQHVSSFCDVCSVRSANMRMMGGDSGPRSKSGDKEEEEPTYFTFLPPHGRSGSPGQNCFR